MNNLIHPPMSRDEAAAIIRSSPGGIVDGKYLMHEHPRDEGKKVLCVAFRGKCTFHLVEKQPDNVITINRKQYTVATTLEEAIEHLRAPVPGWPVMLDECIPPLDTRSAQEHEPESSDTQTSTPVLKASQRGINAHHPSRPGGIDIVADDTSEVRDVAPPRPQSAKPYVHPEVRVQGGDLESRTAVEVRMPPSIPGSEEAAAEQDHEDHQDSEGDRTGAVARQLASGSQQGDEEATLPETPAAGLLSVDNKTSATTHEDHNPRADEDGAPIPDNFWEDRSLWLHGVQTRSEADALMRAVMKEGESGAFFIRRRANDPDGDTLALVVTRDGRPTHHLLRPQDGVWLINSRPLHGCGSVEEVVEALASHRDDWPLPLTRPIPPASAAQGHTPATPADSNTAVNAPSAAEVSDEPSPLASRYMQEAAPLTRWKCGMCGSYNDFEGEDDPSTPRVCKHCNATRSKRRASEHEDIEPIDPNAVGVRGQPRRQRPPSETSNAQSDERQTQSAVREPDPRRLEARAALVEVLRSLPYDYASNIEHALQQYTKKKCSLLHLVTSLSLVCRRIDSASRQRLEESIALLIPSSYKDDFELLVQRARKEEYLELLMKQGDRREYEILGRLVARGLSLFSYGRLPGFKDMNRFQQFTHLASVKRGWAAIRWQADDVSMSHIDIELIAREIHIGWGRAVRLEWDFDAYGTPTHGKPTLNAEGLLDSDNFASGAAYRLYAQRAEYSRRLYLLPSQSLDEAMRLQRRINLGHAGDPLTRQEKEGYRVAAEILLNAFKARYPQACRGRHMLREDPALYDELIARDIIRIHHMGAAGELVEDESDHLASSRPYTADTAVRVPRAGPPSYEEEFGLSNFQTSQLEFGF